MNVQSNLNYIGIKTMRYFYASITIANLKRKLTISIDFGKWTVTETLTQCHWKCKTINSLENTV